jgi:ferredoxin-NADP reductase
VLVTLPIREVLPATPRARILRLDLGGDRFEYSPGQAVLIARHHYAPRKPYSIASAPEDAARDGVLELLIGTERSGRPGPHLTLDAGAPVDVEGPVGTFTFPDHPKEQRFVFIAGGTGIAPLRAMLRHALTLAHHDIGVLYSARAPEEFAYEAELRGLAESGQIRLHQTVTRATEAPWSGARGRLDREALRELVHDPATLCFVCGPPALVAEVPGLLTGIGVPRERIRLEEWASS